MIIKTSYFKKLVERAYKYGVLIVGNTGEYFKISKSIKQIYMKEALQSIIESDCRCRGTCQMTLELLNISIEGKIKEVVDNIQGLFLGEVI